MSDKNQAVARTETPANSAAQLETLKAMLNMLNGAAGAAHFSDVKVERTGTRIILPENMSYADAHLWLKRKEDAEEKVVKVYVELSCYPLDGMLALSKALQIIYGFTNLTSTPTFFGEKPPVIIQVPTGVNTTEPAVYGRIQPPTLEGGYLEAVISHNHGFTISGEVKRKFEKEVERVFEMTKQVLAEHSIYKGHAIMLDLSYLRPGKDRPFDPTQDAPKFMDLDGVTKDKLILNAGTEFSLTTSILTLLTRSEECRANGIPLKHGALFMGPYGTGKTMTARVIAAEGTKHGWTFIYLKQPDQISVALKLAEQYAPAVVFAEDIDQVTSGERDQGLNDILNTLDGIDTKDKPVITILTTNHPEKIHPGFLRAGRIDSVIHMEAPDCVSAQRFVHLYAGNGTLLVPGMDLKPIGEALAGFVPAFISEAVQRAKRRAVYRDGMDINGKVTTEDLLLAAGELKKHIEMVNRDKTASKAEQMAAAVDLLQSNLASATTDQFQQLMKKMNESF